MVRLITVQNEDCVKKGFVSGCCPFLDKDHNQDFQCYLQYSNLSNDLFKTCPLKNRVVLVELEGNENG